VCLAQAPEPTTDQKILSELQSIRASLERRDTVLTALLALSRAQIDAIQVVALESQRQRLSAQEQRLGNEVAAATRAVNAPPPMIMSPDGSVAVADQSDATAMKTGLEQVSAALRDIQGSESALDREIARLKSRIAEMEKVVDKVLEEALRKN
jgi:hypothetical protein